MVLFYDVIAVPFLGLNQGGGGDLKVFLAHQTTIYHSTYRNMATIGPTRGELKKKATHGLPSNTSLRYSLYYSTYIVGENVSPLYETNKFKNKIVQNEKF